ncbi:MAG: LCP family protein [Oscillospiraceae bacterium]
MSRDNNQQRPQRPLYDQDAGRQVYNASSSAGRPQQSGAARPQQRAAGQAATARRQPSYGQYQSYSARPRQTQRPRQNAEPSVYAKADRDEQRYAQQRSTTAVKSRKKAKRGRKIAIALILVLFLGAAGAFALYSQLQSKIQGQGTQAGTLPDDINTLPEFKGDMVSFLVCGIDYDNEGADGYSNENKIGRTDMILYVYYNIKEQKVALMQIPRDTYVGKDLSTGNTYKINGLYYNAKDKDNRMAALAQVINDQYKLPVDFYITIDLDALKDLVDHIGGLKVYVPEKLVDPENSKNVIEAGWRVLDGATTEFVVRNRTSPSYNQQGDIARLRTQQHFYSALYREFTQLSPTDLVMWMKVLLGNGYIKTDANVLDLGGIAQDALKLTGENITFVRPACGPVSYNGVSLISLDAQEMANLLNQYFRPDGQSYSLQELSIPTIPFTSTGGVAATEVKTMSSITETEV